MTAALERAIAVLACPICGELFIRVDTAFTCRAGHAFDIARQGYASLTTGGGPHFVGDSQHMVTARDAYLAEGHYRPIADAIASTLPPTGWCVELAGGTGYYASRVLDAVPGLSGVTIDVSKYAARVAARAHPRLASATGDVTARLPLRSGSADVILSVFGPRRGDEVARILAPGGSVIVVTPLPSHLIELREQYSLLAIGADKEARLSAAMSPLALVDSTELEYRVILSPQDVVNSIMMGPNAFHRDLAQIEASAAVKPDGQSTTIAVTVSRFEAALS